MLSAACLRGPCIRTIVKLPSAQSLTYHLRSRRSNSSQITPRLHHFRPPPDLLTTPFSASSSSSSITGLRIIVSGSALVLPDEHSKLHWLRMPKAAFYAVAAGREPGIYSTWTECEAQVKGYTSAKFKKFNTQSEAQAFVGIPVPGQAPRSKHTRTPYDPPPTSTPQSSKAGSTSKAFRPVVSDTSTPFTLAEKSTLPPDLARIADEGFSFTTHPHRLIVYTDGSSLSNGKANARAGLGVFWGDKGRAAECNIAERVPGELQTNNRGELLSVIRAIEKCPYPDLSLEVRTDSQYTISCITLWLPKWIEKNFNGVKNDDMIKHLWVLLRLRGNKRDVKFRYVAGHSGERGNEAADVLARQGASMGSVPDRTDWLDPDEDDEPLGTSQVEVELDERWLLTEDELAALEGEFSN